jgi:hypothetical protein
VKKLIEGLQFYWDKLHEEVVFARFTEILAKVGKRSLLGSTTTDEGCFDAGAFEQVGEQTGHGTQ